MNYYFIEKPLLIGTVSNFKGVPKSDKFVCGLTIYKKTFSLDWVNGEGFENCRFQETNIFKFLHPKTGIGIIKYENNNFYVYAISGKELYQENFASNRNTLADTKIQVYQFTYKFPHHYNTGCTICYIKNEAIIDESLFKNIGFFKVDDELDYEKFSSRFNSEVHLLFKDIKEKFKNTYVSNWYSKFAMQQKNEIWYYSDVQDRMLNYYDSEWKIWNDY